MKRSRVPSLVCIACVFVPGSASGAFGLAAGADAYTIPSGALSVGKNTLEIEPVSGSTDLGPWLSASWVYDANDDGQVDIADAIALLSHLLAGAGDLPEPSGACGADPTADTLGCSNNEPCSP